MQIKLETLLSYKNSFVLSRYEHDYPYAKLKAEEAFRELMKFMWLSLKHKAEKEINPENHNLDFTCVIHPEMQEIDFMWHIFLLFTHDYHDFCRDYLDGYFFHHYPNTDLETPPDDFEVKLSRYLSYIYDHLGEQTLLAWFSE